MLISKLTSKEMDLARSLYNPKTLLECLFKEKIENFDSLQQFKDNDFFKLRFYQIPFVSYEYMIANDPKLTDTENFRLKMGSGSGYYYCGRKIGKSLVALLMDLLLDTVYNCNDWVTAFSSFDAVHVKHILEPYIKTVTTHPFFKMFKPHVVRHPVYCIDFPLGHKVEGVNMNLASKHKKGSQWERVHASKMYIDEHQYEDEEVVNKRSQSVSERGCIERFAGITSFKRHSPAGKIFDNLEKRNHLVNLPQTVSHMWTPETKQKAIEDYDGEDSLGYKVHVMAQVCEDAEGLYNMESIRASYNKKRRIKNFEVSKENYDRFKELIIVERPKIAERIYVSADFGETAPTEIIIMAEIIRNGESFYKYLYNITLHRLVPDEQTEIFKYIAESVSANFIGIDCSEEGGRQIYRDLSKFYKKENLCWVSFQEKIPVAFAKDTNKNIIMKNGKPVYEEEYVIDWAVRRLKVLLYDGNKTELAYDYKLDKQFGGMKSMFTGNRVKYGHLTEDHLHSAFQVWAIMEWSNAFNLVKSIKKKSWGVGEVSWT